MELQAKKSISLSSITFFTAILLGTMGWVVVLSQLQEKQGEGLAKGLIGIGEEVLKVVVIAVAAGIAVEKWLERETLEDPRAALRMVGIKEIFPKRQDAGAEFLRSVRDENIRRILISGISLRDFLNNGALQPVWREMCERLKREQELKLPADQRLHVRLLLLLPNSNEGYFRHQVEGENLKDPGGIPFDIPHALSRVRGAQQDIFGGYNVPYLQVRLYEHCPFAFIFATEGEIFVEQYDYRDQSKPPALPLIEYQSGTDQYKEQMFSAEVVWRRARQAEFLDQVGTAAAIREARVENIFRREHRPLLTKRQVAAIREAGAGTIDILAISGHFYTSNPVIAPELQVASLPAKSSTGELMRPAIPVRFAIINPVSQQAILRAVADGSPPEQVGEQLFNWNWPLHQQSALYTDARATASTLYSWSKQRKCSIDVKVYSSSVSCMILQTDRRAFIEQYMYGRSKEFQPGFNLGGEYPVIEYDVSKIDGGEMVEHQVIAATFEMTWNFFSISWERYLAGDERAEFELNLSRLREELREGPSQSTPAA